jgi:hypothetical protein
MRENKVDTTLGDLIEAVSEAAFEYSDNPREVYLYAQLALVEILKDAPYPVYSGDTLSRKFSYKSYLN